MSHVISGEVTITDLEALRAALAQRAQTWRFAFFLLLLLGSIAFYNSTQDHASQLRTADFTAYSQGAQDAEFGFDDHDDPDQVASFSTWNVASH